VQVVDTLPMGMDVANATWDCTATGTSNCGNASGTGNIDELVSVAPDETVTFVLTTSPLVGSGLEFVTNVASQVVAGDLDAGNDSDSVFNLVGEIIHMDSFEDPIIKRRVTVTKEEDSSATLAINDLDARELVELVPTPVGLALDESGQTMAQVHSRSQQGQAQLRVALRAADGTWRITNWVDLDLEADLSVEFNRFDAKATNQLEAVVREGDRTLITSDNR
jgi:hypothetical protein